MRKSATRVPYRSVPTARGAATGRPVCKFLLRLGWRVRVFGAGNVPADGPVILAGNHTGVFDGPVMFGTSPRPAHVVTKREVFIGPVGSLLHSIGQIELNRQIVDFPAILAAWRVLTHGRVLGLYPEGERSTGDFSRIKGGIAYLALRTGAPVVPMANFGVVRPGQSSSLPPSLRSAVDVVYGTPFTVEAAEAWGPYLPRRIVGEMTEHVRVRLLDHLAYACELTEHPWPDAVRAGARLDVPVEGDLGTHRCAHVDAGFDVASESESARGPEPSTDSSTA